ncbi:DUF2784 domain-containing protein [Alkalimonas collagenimarina]|uniref:DUF2784 domain-containing protein n=1 Tax=Alkalimonas collagenimarina TaxID=400390 RepID=A0ABT9H3K2_9GAMM|nr:DUF2784 domain-containing protein [Alkalimonas collagenimarina]MDP4537788.1 DUF2784 domain-containing protein [Alkalimonas collagenimarina]
MTTPWYDRVPAPDVMADVILLLHGFIVIFVMGGLLFTLIGGIRQWSWVRNPVFRLLQLAIVLVVVVQSLRGRYCPLTYWEVDLRRAAGQSAYDSSFIEFWVSNLIYYDAPAWVFTLGYSIFFFVVVLSWWLYPPRFRS